MFREIGTKFGDCSLYDIPTFPEFEKLFYQYFEEITGHVYGREVRFYSKELYKRANLGMSSGHIDLKYFDNELNRIRDIYYQLRIERKSKPSPQGDGYIKSVGEYLLDFRMFNDLTVEEASLEIGIPVDIYYDLEDNTVDNIKSEVCDKVARYFGSDELKFYKWVQESAEGQFLDHSHSNKK